MVTYEFGTSHVLLRAYARMPNVMSWVNLNEGRGSNEGKASECQRILNGENTLKGWKVDIAAISPLATIDLHTIVGLHLPREFHVQLVAAAMAVGLRSWPSPPERRRKPCGRKLKSACGFVAGVVMDTVTVAIVAAAVEVVIVRRWG